MTNRITALAALITCFPVLPSAAIAQTVTSLQAVPQTLEVGVGERKSLLVTAYDARGNVVPTAQFLWNSGDPSVASVEATAATPNIGYVVGHQEGTAVITVRAGAIQETVTVQVSGTGACAPGGSGDAAQLQVFPDPVQLLLTEERAMQVRFLRSDGGAAACRQVSWRSLRTGVATVDRRGHVIGIDQGNGVIQADAGGGLVSRVVVQVTTDTFRFQRDVISLPPAESDSLVVVVPAQGNRTIDNSELQWATTNPNVALVSTTGVVTGVTAGSAQIVARAFGKDTRIPVIVHRPVAMMEVSPRAGEATVYVPLNGSVVFRVDMLDASEVVIEEARPSWVVADRSIISVDRATGRVTGRKMGTTRLTARGPGVEAVWNVEVVGPNITIDMPRVGLSKGEQQRLTAAFMDDDGNRLGTATDLVWTSLSPDVATVDEQGNVTGVGFGGAPIVAAAGWGEADTISVYVQGEVLVTGYNAEGVPDLYSFDTDSVTVIAKITDNLWTEVSPRFSPDGTRIAYVTNAVGNNKIFVMNADGSDPQRLTALPDTIIEDGPVWTPDGSRIVFGAAGNLWSINADGTDARQLTSGDSQDSQAAVSPDGSTVAYQSIRRTGADLYLMTIDGGQQRPVSETPELEMRPVWFSNTELGYISQQGSRRNQSQMVMRVNLNTGAAVQVTPEDIWVQDYDVSADGNKVVFTIQEREEGQVVRKLYVLSLAGATAGAPVEVPRIPPVRQYYFPAFKR
jgi:Tol biopolymer transport system component